MNESFQNVEVQQATLIFAQQTNLNLLQAVHQLHFHLYAQNKQGIRHKKPPKVITSNAEYCVDDVRSSCASKRIQVNDNETKVLWWKFPIETGQQTSVVVVSSTSKVIHDFVRIINYQHNITSTWQRPLFENLGVYNDAEQTCRSTYLAQH